jgi:hypothetical protein
MAMQRYGSHYVCGQRIPSSVHQFCQPQAALFVLIEVQAQVIARQQES